MSVCPPVRRSFSDEHGTGAFNSFGDLPKRTRETSSRKPPVFHIAHDNDDEHSSSLDDERTNYAPVSFQNPSSSSPISTACPTTACLRLSRGTSAPILLSNGKPLKSSLAHRRSHSEPSTPKNVHFPERGHALATVHVFDRSARTAALSHPSNGNNNGDETETEGEDIPPARYPFPSQTINYEIDLTNSSSLPSKTCPHANILLESLNLLSPSFSSTSPTTILSLTGSVIVRNLAFEKYVAIRFTLDDWETVSEVGAHYVGSLPLQPSKISSLPSPEEAKQRGWDRFTFTIHLEDYVHSLRTRTLWLAAHYRIDSTYPESGSSQYGPGGEWWDNNGGKNYRVGFRHTIAAPTPPRSRPRRETISAPISSPRIQLQSPMTKEHALSLMIMSVHRKENRRLTPLRTEKLDLCNYVPPTVRVTPSVPFPCKGPPQTSSPPSVVDATLPPLTALGSPSDEDSLSPASSTPSTPSVSPARVPWVIIGGQPAPSTYSSSENDDEGAITCSKIGLTAGLDWSEPSKPWVESPFHQCVDVVPGSEPQERLYDIPSPLGRKVCSGSNSLYDALVMQWCFAKEPSPNHHGYDGCGTMA